MAKVVLNYAQCIIIADFNGERKQALNSRFKLWIFPLLYHWISMELDHNTLISF